MRHLLLFYFSLNISIGFCQKTDQQLVQVFEHERMGYINELGQVIISPQFRNGGQFTEGLATARIDGTYGYINTIGEFVIQPQFDFATPFNEGLALVYKNGKPLFIDRQGQFPFEINFPDVEPFENGTAKIYTESEKIGFIDKLGHLTVDTSFTKIRAFVQGMAVVEGLNHHAYPDKENGIEINYEVGVINRSGRFIIPYGKYMEISDFEDGYFKAEIEAEPWDTIKGYTQKTAYIGPNGDLIFSKSFPPRSWVNGMHCGLARINLYKPTPKSEKPYESENHYEGFIDLSGEVFIDDTTFKRVWDFADNRAFVKKENGNYHIINTRGEILTPHYFSNVIGNGFKNGLAFVQKDGKYGLIDTTANFIIEPKFDGIDYVGLMGDYFFFSEQIQLANEESEKLYGIAQKDGSIVLEPTMQLFDKKGFKNKTLLCIIKGRLSYINEQGKIIWQELDENPKPLSRLNIDYMNRGYFYAYSEPNEEDLGGFGSSGNTPKKIAKNESFPIKSLSVVVRPETKNSSHYGYYAKSVYVVNNTKKNIEFNAQDSRLYMKVQALNVDGEWKDIEYLPSSWCGNSYHTLTLGPKQYWALSTPDYGGDFQTKFRIELKYLDPEDKPENIWEKKEITIYSNEYEGSINPGQFWRKQDYHPNGIMDPYYD